MDIDSEPPILTREDGEFSARNATQEAPVDANIRALETINSALASRGRKNYF